MLEPLFAITLGLILVCLLDGEVQRSKSLQWLKDRVLFKIEGWKGNLLNQAGKEALIKSVIQVIPSYIMVIVKLP